tara:strand:- start:1673 stop:6718 length:5046 start_codon:yes stop_codon:yes gene_type:complete
MAKYVFKPISDSTLGTSRLTFERLSLDESGSPNPVTTNLESSIKKGDFVYALTKQAAIRTQNFPNEPLIGQVLTTDSSGNIIEGGTVLEDSDGNIITYDGTQLINTKQNGYSISDFEMAKVVDVFLSGDNQYVYVDIDKVLKTDVYGTTGGFPALADQFLFERDINKINEAKIGFDRDGPQLVSAEVSLSDTVTGQNLQDSAFNDLVTNDVSFFDAALKSGNSTSVNVSNDTSVGSQGGPVKVSEEFPQESETSSSLLGVPRAETQLSLFSDVSTLGLEEKNWEVIPSVKSKLRNDDWETRASEEGGSRYIAKLIENTTEQALELSSNNAPYSYPWPDGNRSFYRPLEWAKWRRFVILGNLLYERFRGTPIADRFLDPAKVRMGTIETPNLRGGGFIITERILYGAGVAESEGFRLIDIWTVTWQKIGNDDFPSITQSVINTEVLSNTSTALISLIGDTSIEDDRGKIGELDLAAFPNDDDKREANYEIYTDELITGLDDFTFSETQPGYLETDDTQQVVLQSKEVFRYQPGRISGFTFGSRTFIDPRVTQNVAEWGVVNETDEYVFQLAGSTLSIIRRSTVPLEDKAIELSTGILQNQVHVNSEEYKESNPAVDDLITNTEKPPYYELKVPSYAFNIDSLDGNGPSGYSLDTRNVTMWKIEFSWYGAIGVVFYAYIPVGDGEARWIKVHRIVIENTLGKACLEDPYFRMRYLLRIQDRTQSIVPQYIYKYGSSVYIDGGDEGTKRPTTFTSNVVNVPEDQDTNPNVDDENNRFTPIIGLLPKKNIFNSDGISRKNRIIAYPESITVDATELVELDFVESTAGNEYGFTYDDGLVWNRDASPAAVPNTVSTGASTSALGVLGSRIQDDSPNAGRTIDVIFEFENVNNAEIAYKLKLVTTDDGRNWRAVTHALDDSPNRDSSPLISVRDHNAKLSTPGLNGYYIDYFATLFDSSITEESGDPDANPPTAVYNTFRVSRIGESDRFNTEEGNGTLYERLPINKDYPILVSSGSGSVGGFTTRFEHIVPNSPYFSFNSPYSGGYQTRTDAGLNTTFQDDFILRHSATHSNIASKLDNNGRRNINFPFIKVPITETKDVTFVDKSVVRNHSNGGIIPYSSLFGKIKVNRLSDAVCSSEDGLVGSEIICRFLNPHAQWRRIGLNRRVNNGAYLGNVWPEFSVGFTPFPPSTTFKDDSTFTIDGTDRKLKDSEFIAVDYTHSNIAANSSLGIDSYYGETNWQLSGLMRDNFRMRAIPNELDHNGDRITDGGNFPASLNSQSPSVLNFNIGGFPSFVKLSIDEKVRYDVFNDATFGDWDALKTALNTDLDGNFDDNVYFPDFPNLSYGSGADTILPTDIGINDSTGADSYIIIDDPDFATQIAAGLSINGGAIVKAGTGDTGETFTSEPVRIQYYVDPAGSRTKQDQKDTGVFNGEGYVIRISGDIGAIERIVATFVKLEYPDGITGTVNRTKRKLFGANPRTFYPYIRLGRGGQLNSINYLQKTPNEGGQVSTSVDWQVYGGAKVHQPLLTTDSRQSSSLRSAGAPKDAGENFNKSDRLSGITADTQLSKPLRSSVSETDFKVLSDDFTQDDLLPGGLRVNSNLRGKLAERAKKIASYYFGNNITAGNNKSRTATVSLRSIFGEDRTKILPDEFGNRAMFIRAQKVNLGDIDTPSANIRISVNVNEI